MYFLRFEVMVATGCASEYEALFARQAALLKQQPGFDVIVLSNALGQPSRYRGSLRWTNREAARAFQLGDAWRDFQRANPREGLVTPLRPIEAYELIHDVGPGGGDYTLVGDWTLNQAPDTRAAFERRCLELFRLRQQHVPAFGRNLLFRYLGNPSRYYVVQNIKSLDGLFVGDAQPAIEDFLRQQPLTALATNVPADEAFVAVQRH